MKVTEALKALMLLRFIPKKDQTGDSATQEILWMMMAKAPDIHFLQTTLISQRIRCILQHAELPSLSLIMDIV
jgi:hypothetical protein